MKLCGTDGHHQTAFTYRSLVQRVLTILDRSVPVCISYDAVDIKALRAPYHFSYSLVPEQT